MDLPIESEAELAGCPWCVKQPMCPHEVLWASKRGGWKGPLAKAAERLDEQLAWAVEALKESGQEPPRRVSEALEQLFETLTDERDELNDYWIALAHAVEGSVIVEVDWDGGPAERGVYTHCYFPDAEAGIAIVLKRAQRDLALLWELEPPPEATPFALFDVVHRWRESRHEDDASLITQALSLWAAELQSVLSYVRCSACHASVPNVFTVPHALCCDAGPAVRRWRLAANEVRAIAEALPERERRKAPPTFETLEGLTSPRYVETIERSLPIPVREPAEQLISLLLSNATPEQLAPTVFGPTDRLSALIAEHRGVRFGPAAQLWALVEAREHLADASLTNCPWCARVLSGGSGALSHLVSCPKHPLVAQAITLEDWCATFRDAARHPVVAVLQRLHERRTGLRHLFAACTRFASEFGWDGEGATVKAGAEREFEKACAAVRPLAQSRPPAPDQPATTVLGDSQRSALKLHDQLASLLDACGTFVRGFNDSAPGRASLETTHEAAWNVARAAAEAALTYCEGVPWPRAPARELPPAFHLTARTGAVFWMTGQSVLRGAALLAAVKATGVVSKQT